MLSPSCAHSLLRSFIRLHGVNHNMPFPTATSLQKSLLHSLFYSFSVLSLKACPYAMAKSFWEILLGPSHNHGITLKTSIPIM
nr:MAG TPA: hypothetical protein [Bacteriophage sp.]